MEPGGPLPHSQEPATCPYPEPAQSSHKKPSWGEIGVPKKNCHLNYMISFSSRLYKFHKIKHDLVIVFLNRHVLHIEQ
jgi:hypothetical protein